LNIFEQIFEFENLKNKQKHKIVNAKEIEKDKNKISNSLNATGPARFGSLAIGGAARRLVTDT
jgi:hypothetical protein